MRASHEDALLCDFSRYYGIREFGTLSPAAEAALADGLPQDARIVQKITGIQYTFDQILLAAILDQLRVANWYNTTDRKHRRNFPESIMEKMLKGPEEKKPADEIETFTTGEAFQRRLAQIKGE